MKLSLVKLGSVLMQCLDFDAWPNILYIFNGYDDFLTQYLSIRNQKILLNQPFPE